MQRGGIFMCCFSTSSNLNSVNLGKNYYKILDVNKTADQKMIKNSYLKLVKTLHPDVNPNGKEKFTEVQEAYEILSNSQKKIYYDENQGKPSDSTQQESFSSKQYSNRQNSQKQYSYTQYERHRESRQNYQKEEQYYDRKRARSRKQRPKEQEYYSYDEFMNMQRERKQYQQWQQQQDKAYRTVFKSFYEAMTGSESRAQRKLSPEELKMKEKIKTVRRATGMYNRLWKQQNVRKTAQMNNFDQGRQSSQVNSTSSHSPSISERISIFYKKVKENLDAQNEKEK